MKRAGFLRMLIIAAAIAVMTVGLCAGVSATAPENEANNYASLVEAFKNTTSGGTISLTSDIDLTGEDWMPIEIPSGTTLTIDGAGHTITGLTSTQYLLPPSSSTPGSGSSCYYYSGFIGVNKGTLTIKNITFTGANISIQTPNEETRVEVVGSSSLAVVVGCNNGTVTMENVTVDGGEVTAYTKGAALVGQANSNITLTNCTVSNFKVNIFDCGELVAAFNSAVLGYTNSGTNLSVTGLKLKNNTFTAPPVNSEWDSVETLADGTYIGKSGGTSYVIWSPTWNNAYVSGAIRVASYNGYEYITLADAVAAAQDGDTITLLHDVMADSQITIPADKNVTLDLNGKTLSGTDTKSNDHYQLIENNGTLTVKDSATGGKISVIAKTNRSWNNYSAAIANFGTLTVESGTIEHLGGTDMAYAIDTNSNLRSVNLTINGGTLKSNNYIAIRAFENSAIRTNDIVVNNGTIEGAKRAIWMQESAAGGRKGSLVINNGIFKGSQTVIQIDSLNATVTTTASINGGYFCLTSNASIPNVAILYIENNNNTSNIASITVTGGYFTTDPTAFVADGYEALGVDYGVYKYKVGAAVAANTYTVSFVGGGSVAALPAAKAGAVRILPEPVSAAPTGKVFAGWSYNGAIYKAGDSFIQPAENVVMTAVWKDAYSISGIVSQGTSGVAGATVKLMLGSDMIASATTDTNGFFSFDNVAPGDYNLRAEKDGVVVTAAVIITDASATITIEMPLNKTNSVVEVAPGTPAVVVGGLNNFTSDPMVFKGDDIGFVAGGGTIELKADVSVTSDPEIMEQILGEANADADSASMFIDVDLTKTTISNTDTKSETITETSNLLSFTIALAPDLQGRASYTVYRMHNGEIDAITSTPNAYGEYLEVSEDRTTITVYMCRFSTLGIVATDTFTITFDPNGGVCDVKTLQTLRGTVTLPYLPTATKLGYASFDGWYTAPVGGERITTETVFTRDTTVYAHWSMDYGYLWLISNCRSLSFVTNGGSSIQMRSFPGGTVVKLAAYIPERAGYEFAGWYLDKALTIPVETVTMNENTVVYAAWTRAN